MFAPYPMAEDASPLFLRLKLFAHDPSLFRSWRGYCLDRSMPGFIRDLVESRGVGWVRPGLPESVAYR